ncbi:MAG: mannonate dehydratase [Promethearchaeota archaeon]
MEFMFRWYGAEDPITLDMIRQISAVDGVVSAIYDVPVGEIWPFEKIKDLKDEISSHGLKFTVIESVPVHEKIKLGHPDRDRLIDNFNQTLRNLGKAGIKVVTYNFMAVFDWMRTNLNYKLADGSYALLYNHDTLQNFDLNSDKLSLPGWDSSYKPEELRSLVTQFQNMTEDDLWDNLLYFLNKIIPIAEETGIKMAIHPDDPPWSIFNLPRIIKNRSDIKKLLSSIESPMNGLALCSGSFGADPNNNIPAIIREFGDRIHFGHIRNIKFIGTKQFHETSHTTESGSLKISEIVKAYADIGYTGPIRPDHGRMIWNERGKPGYGLYDRALGIMYLKGLWEGIQIEKNEKNTNL